MAIDWKRIESNPNGVVKLIGSVLLDFRAKVQEQTIEINKLRDDNRTLAARMKEMSDTVSTLKLQLQKQHTMMESDRIDKLKKLVQVSKKVKVSQMAQILRMDEVELNERIVDWAEEYGFTLDGDFVEFGAGRKDEFINALNDAFSDWDKKTGNKFGKLGK